MYGQILFTMELDIHKTSSNPPPTALLTPFCSLVLTVTHNLLKSSSSSSGHQLPEHLTRVFIPCFAYMR